MAIKIQKRNNESASAFLFRVSQVIQKSGVLLEAMKHQQHIKKPNERKKKLSALHRIKTLQEIERRKKLGLPIK